MVNQLGCKKDTNMKMMFTLWDVEHGLAIWINTPKGYNHWIDAGKNSGTDFSPAEHVYRLGETDLDYLIISHPDADHINDLPDVIRHLKEPRVLCRNSTLPDFEKYGNCSLEYQQVFRDLDKRYTEPVLPENSPSNSTYNGGIKIETSMLTYSEANRNLNDTSVVAFYLYTNWLFVCPGDIEPTGWPSLWQKSRDKYAPLIQEATHRILIAPHHGRPSAYSQEMMDDIVPNLVLISDEYGQAETDSRYRSKPTGLDTGREMLKFLSTKTSGRIQFNIWNDGPWSLDYYGTN